jgi:hypothetical protein
MYTSQLLIQLLKGANGEGEVKGSILYICCRDRKKMETGMSWERKELVQEGCCVGWRELRVEGVEVLG